MSTFDFGTLTGIATAVLLVTFIGVVAWSWSARRRHDFAAAARLPLDDEEAAP